MRRAILCTLLLAAIVTLATAETPFTTRDGELGKAHVTQAATASTTCYVDVIGYLF